MKIGVLQNLKINAEQNYLFDLFEGFMIYRLDIPLFEVVVQEEEEMRVDLLFQRIYNLEPNEFYERQENIDILLFINHIDNPLNIKKGMIIKYPSLDSFGAFRYLEDPDSRSRNTTPILAVPNVSTKKDKDRQNYKKNEFSLPPVAQPVPKSPIRRENGIVKIGGI